MAKDKTTSIHFDREKRWFVGLDDKVMKQLCDSYPSINVASELNKMSLWLMTSNGKKRKGNIGFILKWLSNASPSAPSNHEESIEQETPLRPLINAYLKELWKGREHILTLNKIPRKS